MANDNFVLLRHLKLSAMRCAAMLTSKLNELTTAFSEDLVELDEAKQDKLTNVEITETICENIIFDDNNLIYTLPSAITLDSDAYYYIDCAYYENGVDGEVNIKYSLHTFSRIIDGVVKWASANDDKAIILNETSIINNWLGEGHTNVISIYKVKINNDINPLDTAALHSTGYKTVAPGGYNATAEGHKTVALGYGSHAEGRENRSLGNYSHTEGAYNYAYGQASHAQGYGTTATSYAQHVEGAFNVEDWEEEYIHIVGNGTSDTERSNAYTLDWNGNGWYYGSVGSDTIRVGKTHMIKTLGGLNVGTLYDDLDESYKDGSYHRMWRLRFPAGVDVCCRLRITVQSTYINADASGAMSKMLNVYFEGENLYNNTGYYDSLGGAVEKDFRISEAIYNSDVGAWEILIWQKRLYGNNGAAITIEGWGDGSHEFEIMNSITLEDVELTQDTSYTASGYNAERDNTRTILWDDTPVLESPNGKKIIVADEGLVTSITADSTDEQIPTAKAVYDATANIDSSTKVSKTGDTMEGMLTLAGDPTEDNHAANKAYVDEQVSSHDHSAESITSGTLDSERLPTVPITKGGTGHTTITDTTYTTARYRASALVAAETNPTTNGVINWTYE